MDNYMIEFLNLDGCYQYETFLAEDQFDAIQIFKEQFPKCDPYAVFMEQNNWKTSENEDLTA